MNQQAVKMRFSSGAEPVARAVRRAVERSTPLRLTILAGVNAAGCLLMLSPVIALAIAAGSMAFVSAHIQGPLYWFLIQVLATVGVMAGLLSFQLYKTRPRMPGGVTISPDQAPDLFAMLERREAHFGIRPIRTVRLRTNADLEIEATPRWPFPLLHSYTLCIGVPLLFFVTASEFRLALAGAISASTKARRSLPGRIMQASRDWAAIGEALKHKPCLASKLLLPAVSWLAALTSRLSSEMHTDLNAAQGRWVLENVDEQTATQLLANQVVATAFLANQYWPMIYKAAEKSPVPVVRPFSHLGILLEKLLDENAAKRWLLQAQAGSETAGHGLRDLLAELGLEYLFWSGLPEINAYSSVLHSSTLLGELDRYWQSQAKPEWDRRHREFQGEKRRFDNLNEKSKTQILRGDSAIRYVQLAERFLDQEQVIEVCRTVFRNNMDNAWVSFACGQALLTAGDIRLGCKVMQHASELDISLANRAHALMNEYQRSSIADTSLRAERARIA